MLTCLTVKYWFILAIISLASHSIGFSFVYATAIGAAQKWFPQHRRVCDNVKVVNDPNCTFAQTDYEQTK